jgi:hypothetical protein
MLLNEFGIKTCQCSVFPVKVQSLLSSPYQHHRLCRKTAYQDFVWLPRKFARCTRHSSDLRAFFCDIRAGAGVSITVTALEIERPHCVLQNLERRVCPE